MIVSSHFKENVSWLDDLGLPYLVVSKGQCVSGAHNSVVIPNRGSEFGSYVWYVLSHWDRLPEKIFFIHGHEDAYHQQYLMPEAIRRFEKSELASLNGEFSVAIHRLDQDHPWFGRYFSEMWRFLGLDFVLSAPSFAVFQPNTQYVVSRSFLKSLGRPFWERVFFSLMTNDAHYHLGMVLEVAWPMIFGVHPNKNPHAVDQFCSFFEDRDLSVLIAHPKEAWHSSLGNTVKFAVPESMSSWISSCMEIFQESAKVY